MFEKRKDSNQEGSTAHFDAGLDDLADSKASQSSGRQAVIGPRISINGEVSGAENLVIEGKVEGKVDLGEHRCDVGQSGQVMADIKAKVVKIDGRVEGDIEGAEKVIISRTGNVRGNIVAPRMTLEDGAKFKGSIDMDPGEPAGQEAATASKSAVKPASKTAGSGDGNGQGHIPRKKDEKTGLTLKSD